MIITFNTAQVATENFAEVEELWRKFVNHRNKKFPGVERTLLKPISGELTEIALMCKHESLASFEAVGKDEREDTEGQELRKRSRPLESHRMRKLYRVVE